MLSFTGVNADTLWQMSSGGLVSALSGCKKTMSFTWIGWPGKDVRPAFSRPLAASTALRLSTNPMLPLLTGRPQIPLQDREYVNARLLEEYQCLPVYIPDDVADRHYNGTVLLEQGRSKKDY